MARLISIEIGFESGSTIIIVPLQVDVQDGDYLPDALDRAIAEARQKFLKEYQTA